MNVAHRFSGPGGPYDGLTTIRKGKVDWSGMARFVPNALSEPLKWKKPARIFVNSMSDLFHESLANEEIAAVFGVMAACPQHTFQVLTKRAERMREWFSGIGGAGYAERICHSEAAKALDPRAVPRPIDNTWPLSNVWLGVSCEDQQRADERIPHLLATPAAVRFVSVEPQLGPVDIRVFLSSNPHLDWVILGGESGSDAREFREEWAWSMLMDCQNARVPVFFKQYGSNSTYSGFCDDDRIAHRWKDRKGSDDAEWFDRFRIREFPGYL